MGTSNLSLLACGAPRLLMHAIEDHRRRFDGARPRCVSLTTSAWAEFIADVGPSEFMPQFKPESLNSCVFAGVRIEHSRRLNYSQVLTADSQWEEL